MSNLPVEVLFKTFEIIKESLEEHDSQKCFYECSLVCKSWNHPSQHYLYSTIIFKHKEQIEKYLVTTEKNKQIPLLVKKLVIKVCTSFDSFYHRAFLIKLFNDSPNLEVINSDYRINYALIVDALYDSKLPKLKIISGSPLCSTDFDNYVGCVMMMKDRIESIRITNRETVSRLDANHNRYNHNHNSATELGDIFYDPMFNKLHHFPRLKELLVTATDNDPIRFLDSVTERCPHIQTLGIDIEKDYFSYATRDPIILSNYKPRPNIKQLHGIHLPLNEPQILLYMMYKYPQLESLDLAFRSINLSEIVEKETVGEFITYLSNIDRVNLHGLWLNLNTFNNVWKNHMNPANMHVTIVYSPNFDDTVAIKVLNGSTSKSEDRTNIDYRGRLGDALGHTNIIENFGEKIRTLVFDQKLQNLPQDPSYSIRGMVYGNVIGHALNHCPQLKELHILNYDIKRINNMSKLQLSDKKKDFQTLRIVRSKIRGYILSDISRVFKSLDHLQIIQSSFYCKKDLLMSADIHMMNTAIGTLTIDFTDKVCKSLFLHIWNSASKKQFYYVMDLKSTEEGILKPSCNRDYRKYMDYDTTFYAYLLCGSVSKLELIYNRYHEHGKKELKTISFSISDLIV